MMMMKSLLTIMASTTLMTGLPFGQAAVTSVLKEKVDSPVDIVFIVDLSGSFEDDVNGLKPLMSGVLTAIEGLFVNPSANLNIGLAGFQDYLGSPYGFLGDRPYFQVLDLGATKDEFVTAFQSFEPTGGGDKAESQLAALYQAATGFGQDWAAIDDSRKDLKDIPAGQGMSWRCKARKLILLYTDASFHRGELEPEYPGPTTEETISFLLNPVVIDIPVDEDGAPATCDPISVIGLSRGVESAVFEENKADILKGIEDLKEIAMATGAVAGPDGVRCDDSDTQIIPEGEPIVCTGITGAGSVIADAIAGIVEGELATCEPGSVLRNNACYACPRGRYEINGACRKCPVGMVAPERGSTQCTYCLDGYLEMGDRITCDACPAGTCKAGTLNECVPCEPGLFQPLPGQGFCLHCPRGHYTADEGNVQCTACAENWVQPQRGQTSCTPCPAGTVEGPRDRCVDASM